MGMTVITVVYHREDGSWWAESEQMAGFSAVGDTFADVAGFVREGVARFVERPGSVLLVEELDDGAVLIHNDAVVTSSGALVQSAGNYGVPSTAEPMQDVRDNARHFEPVAG